ncbi:chitin synthase-domain-containing protein [Chytriomyces sp. MP71]|nr:chitin synthase-domain-containing protein [Chytriomyces sp. MP71]
MTRYAACVENDGTPLGLDTQGCTAIALAFGYSDAELRVGVKRVFLADGAWRELEAHLGILEMQRADEDEVLEEEAGAEDKEQASTTESHKGDVAPLDEVKVTSPPAQPRGVVVKPVSAMRKRWVCFTWSLTWCIPTLVLRICCKLKRPDIQMAWREKVALCLISASVCSIVLFLIIGLGQILCPLQKILSQGEIDGYNTTSKPLVSMYGAYYEIPDIIKDHVYSQDYVNLEAMKQTTLGHDVSAMFYKTTVWSNYCNLPQPSGFDNIVRTIPKDSLKVWYPHQGNDAATGKPIDYVASVQYMRKGMVARNGAWIDQFLAADPANNRIIVAYGNVYDVSAYADSTITKDFLGANVGKIIAELGGSGVDATKYMEQVRQLEGYKKWADYVGCLNGLFLTGVVDHRQDERCLISNYIMLGASAVLALIIGLKFITALQCGGRRNPETNDKYVLCQVPCYTEGADSLRKTFESLLLSSYLDSRKLLFVIADGMIVGGGNDRPTPRIVLDVLGWHGDESEHPPVLFQSLGDGMKQMNRAKVYSGYYAIQGKSMPYIVVTKVGMPNESNRPGNRGKRDSQLLIMRFLNHVHLDAEMTPMELEIVWHMKQHLRLDPHLFEYLLWVDADTEIMKDSINRLVACLVRDSRVIGICGETMVGNEMESWVTAIQVYEYFISHHLSKQFESVFGSVTCLPGCFSMYRIRSSNRATPFLISNDVIRDFAINQVDTLHLKNLLHLGEDRYLTTLLMKHFPGYKLTFAADAKCKTQAPAQWAVFVSQRRRWINSTVHTLCELLLLPQLCGCCMFSMRVVVFIDLFSTLAQPSALMYFGFLIYSAVSDTSQGVPLFSLIMIASIYGAQMVIFMMKGEFQHLGWMIIYLLAIPVYSFYLPIYAFWHFDDFSWGNTRVVVDATGGRVYEREEEVFDPSLIPVKKWSDREQELQPLKSM